MIVGNPPYTHLRSLQNRRYAAYSKQRDMAQVFVRWALDHLTHRGACSLNTSDAWLNVKTSDGALETRQSVDRRIREINKLELYSEGGGGNIPTFIICLTGSLDRDYLLDGVPCYYDDRDLARFNFVPVIVSEYRATALDTYSLPVSLNNGKSNPKINQWVRGKCYLDGDHSMFLILAPRHLGSRVPGAKFKLCRIHSGDLQLSGEWKYLQCEDDAVAFWLFGCLNSKVTLSVVQRSLRKVSTDGNDRGRGDWIVKLDNRKLAALQVPDFDWYKENHPERHAAFLNWIESNMRDKDSFLAGIDEQFERLIADG